MGAMKALFLLVPVLCCGQSHLSNLKQLTRGGQNAEAYWSPDGKKLIFQSTRGESQCDQIYTMKADGSDQKMVSTGKGVTTCGYFLPDSKHFVYASTHEAGPACPAPADHVAGIPSARDLLVNRVSPWMNGVSPWILMYSHPKNFGTCLIKKEWDRIETWLKRWDAAH